MKARFSSILFALALPLLASCQGSERKAQHENCIFLALSWANYVQAEGHLPQNGKLSWRVEALKSSTDPMAIKLYSKFHMDESWDSPHNKALIKEIPFYYQDASPNAKKGDTCYLGITGDNRVQRQSRREGSRRY